MKKYLLYAIGEIVLVIIGILIALGISNWNQNKQLKNDNIDLQKKVLVRLKKDIITVQNFQKDIDTLNQTYLKVLDRKYDKSKVNENGVVSTILFEMNTLRIDQELNNLIENAELDDSETSQELINLNSTYRQYMKYFENIEKLIFDKKTANLAELEKTQPWYTDLITDFVCRNDCIKYLLYDEGHKSRIASSRFLIASGYGSIVNEFEEILVEYKDELEDALSTK
ncbi:hypothetical protein [Psychroserpens sp.]|uniref:hypothetical protein n=1 Tax=Psychroserpens sp. TaxID=2020870 RepID=UPI0038595AAD